MDLQLLILCGGQSSRMGFPKHRLSIARSEPIYETLFERCRQASPSIGGFYLSLRNPKQLADLNDMRSNEKGASVLFDSELVIDGQDVSDIGPAAGLLAAYQACSTTHWLVLACDYPLITSHDIAHLVQHYQAPLTCFINASQWPEPLLAIWSPQALGHLKANVANGVTGPKNVVHDLGGRTLKPLEEHSMFNVNTRKDWEKVVGIAARMGLDS